MKIQGSQILNTFPTCSSVIFRQTVLYLWVLACVCVLSFFLMCASAQIRNFFSKHQPLLAAFPGAVRPRPPQMRSATRSITGSSHPTSCYCWRCCCGSLSAMIMGTRVSVCVCAIRYGEHLMFSSFLSSLLLHTHSLSLQRGVHSIMQRRRSRAVVSVCLFVCLWAQVRWCVCVCFDRKITTERCSKSNYS